MDYPEQQRQALYVISGMTDESEIAMWSVDSAAHMRYLQLYLHVVDSSSLYALPCEVALMSGDDQPLANKLSNISYERQQLSFSFSLLKHVDRRAVNRARGCPIKSVSVPRCRSPSNYACT